MGAYIMMVKPNLVSSDSDIPDVFPLAHLRPPTNRLSHIELRCRRSFVVCGPRSVCWIAIILSLIYLRLQAGPLPRLYSAPLLGRSFKLLDLLILVRHARKGHVAPLAFSSLISERLLALGSTSRLVQKTYSL